jgi:hypothetical protein
VIQINNTVVIPFPNVDRRKNGGAEIPSHCGKGHPLTPDNVRIDQLNTAGAVGGVVASALRHFEAVRNRWSSFLWSPTACA